jgi:Flp pilus assembly protein TadD
MRLSLAAAVGVFLAVAWSAWGQVADDRYLRVYSMIEEADKLKLTGDGRSAVNRYLEAQVALKDLQQGFPEWNPKLLAYRLEYVNGQLATLTEKHSAAATNASPAEPSADAQLKQLEEEIARLSSQNALLEAKLREAFKVQPAAVDPRELEKAEQRIKQLQKERDLLRVTIEQSATKPGGNSPAETKKNLVTQSAVAGLLQKQNEELQKQIIDLTARLKTVARPGSSREALALKETIAALEASNRIMKEEQTMMENRLKDFIKRYGSATVQRQNELEKELAAAREAAKVAEQERDALIEKLNTVTRQLNERTASTPTTPTTPNPAGTTAANAATKELETQLESIRAKLQIFEARNVPYTPEELALFQQPPIKLASAQTNAVPAPAAAGTATTATTPPPRELPADSQALLVDAQHAVEGNRFAEAEQRYRQLLTQDDKNAFVLAKLAAVQMDQDKLPEAEATLQQALAVSPQDPVALYLSGGLKLRQEKYDEAVEALSLSAKIDPEKAQTHYLLGQALIQKGSRGPAEASLRRALQLKPAWSEAHYLLAVLYAQEPNFRELARYHYNRALSGGASRNYQLELFMGKAAKP